MSLEEWKMNPKNQPKTKNNLWCPECGGAGEWLKRENDDPKKPLEHHNCHRCRGAGVVAKVMVKR